VSTEALHPPTVVQKLRWRATGRPPRQRSGFPSDVGVTWDENAAFRMLKSRAHGAYYTGAIWVTDLLAGGSTVAPGIIDVLRAVDGIFVNSRAQLEPLRDLLGNDGPKLKYFSFGIDQEFFAPRPFPSRPMVLSVGNDRDRDPVTLLSALEEVHRLRPEADLVVQSTSSHTFPDGVRKLDRVPHAELRNLYARSSVVATATKPNLHMSGLTVSLEAMSMARPVVKTDTAGSDDYFGEGRGVVLVPPSDASALAKSIIELLDDPRRAERMGVEGRSTVEERFTTRHLAKSIAEFVAEGAGRRSGRQRDGSPLAR
jgi:glycosyltransferase involved in cell wall biosynthesis